MTGNGQDPKPEKNKQPIVVRRRRARRAKAETPSLDALSASGQSQSVRTKTPGLLNYTLLYFFKSLYLLGVTLLRRMLKIRRSLRRGRRRLFDSVRRTAGRAMLFASRIWKSSVRRVKSPFVRIGQVRSQMRPVIERSRQDGKVPLRAYGRIALTFLRMLYAIVRTLVNYGAPVLVAVLVYRYIGVELNRPMALLVEYNGVELGYIENEATFESATGILRERYIADDVDALATLPTFQLVELPEEEEYTEAKDLANAIVYVSDSEIEWGYGFYIDNTFYGAVSDYDEYAAIYDELAAIRAANSIGVQGEDVQFVKTIKLEDGLYPVSSLVDGNDLLDVIHSSETVDEYYIVEEGDSPLLVADKTGIPLTTLESLNGDLTELMIPGEEILTQVAQPFLSVMNVYTTVYREEVPYQVEEIPTALYSSTYRSVEQDGIPGEQEVTALVSAVNGVIVEQTVQETRLVTAPVPERVVVGTSTPAPTPSPTPSPVGPDGGISTQGFLWPTNGGYMTSYPGHTGVDIARPYGTNIYASRSGQVILARNTGVGYGRYIMVDHGDGYVTLYAHASALYVNVGDWVNQGDTIAAVGSTGNSTGNHLHFEVRYNGQIMNPRNYIG